MCVYTTFVHASLCKHEGIPECLYAYEPVCILAYKLVYGRTDRCR